MAILIKTYVENIENKSFPFEAITSEEYLNINRTIWEDGYNPEEEEDFYCPVFEGIINLEIDGKVFWGKEVKDFCYEISMLWMHFGNAIYAIYRANLEGKPVRKRVGGEGHGVNVISMSTSESDQRLLIVENIGTNVREEINIHQFIISALTEANAFYEKLDTLFPKPDSLIKEDLLKARSTLQELQKAQDNLLHD